MADAKASDPSRIEPAPQGEAVPAPARAAAKRASDPDPERLLREAWSRRMLPWMLRMLVGLTVFFFVASAAQLAYLHYEITTTPETDLSRPLAMMGGGSEAGTGEVGPGGLPAAAVAALSVLELGAIERRYHQANVSLLSRVWTRYLGFVTGMVLAMVGQAVIPNNDQARDNFFRGQLYAPGGVTLYCHQPFTRKVGLEIEHVDLSPIYLSRS